MAPLFVACSDQTEDLAPDYDVVGESPFQSHMIASQDGLDVEEIQDFSLYVVRIPKDGGTFSFALSPLAEVRVGENMRRVTFHDFLLDYCYEVISESKDVSLPECPISLDSYGTVKMGNGNTRYKRLVENDFCKFKTSDNGVSFAITFDKNIVGRERQYNFVFDESAGCRLNPKYLIVIQECESD